jgi:hypothetical protein
VDLIVIGVLVIALGYAWWQNRKAARAYRALNLRLEEIPAKSVFALRLVIPPNQGGSVTSPESGGEQLANVAFLDVNGDGHEELLVQYPTGSHGSELKIFGWQDGEFKQLARLGVGTPTGFDFGDFDGDGRIEIRTEETDWTPNQPYVSAPRLLLLFRWHGTDFVEISRQRSPNIPPHRANPS